MHQKQREKYLTRSSKHRAFDHTMQEILSTAKNVLLTQKLLGNTKELDLSTWDTESKERILKRGIAVRVSSEQSEWIFLSNLARLSEQLNYISLKDFLTISKWWKSYLPRLNKAMARRMLLSYKKFLRDRETLRSYQLAEPCPDYYRIIVNQDLQQKQNRLYPLTFDQYTKFAEHVYVKRGSPKYYKKKITGIRWGLPRSYKDKDESGYPVKRYVGVQVIQDEETKRWRIKMGIVNEKIVPLYANSYMR